MPPQYFESGSLILHDARTLTMDIKFGLLESVEETVNLENYLLDWIEEHFADCFIMDWRGVRASGTIEKLRDEIANSRNTTFFRGTGKLRTSKIKSLNAYRNWKQQRQTIPEMNDETALEYFTKHIVHPRLTGDALKEALLAYYNEPRRVGKTKYPFDDLNVWFNSSCIGDFCRANFSLSFSLEAAGCRFEVVWALLRNMCEALTYRYPEACAFITLQPYSGGFCMFGIPSNDSPTVFMDPFYSKRKCTSPYMWYIHHLLVETGVEHWISAYTRQYLPKDTSFDGLTYRELPNGGFHVAIPKSPLEVDVADFAVMKNALYDIYLPRYQCYSYDEIYYTYPIRYQWSRTPVFPDEITVSHKRVMFSHYPRKSDWAVRVFGPLPELWEDDWL